MFKVNNKKIRAMSLTYFTSFSSVCIVLLELVNVSREGGDCSRWQLEECFMKCLNIETRNSVNDILLLEITSICSKDGKKSIFISIVR